MWPFRSKTSRQTRPPTARAVSWRKGVAIIDVRGQTCPGYLLAINRAVEGLAPGTEAELLITYPPCGDDVQAWCKEKGIAFLGIEAGEHVWRIRIRKPPAE